MEYLGVFGFIAFVMVLTLQGKVSKLERQMREGGFGEQNSGGSSLSESLEKRIGKQVKFDFYDEEAAADLVSAKQIKIVDVDEKWVLVHCEGKRKSFDKMIRISSIKGITEV